MQFWPKSEFTKCPAISAHSAEGTSIITPGRRRPIWDWIWTCIFRKSWQSGLRLTIWKWNQQDSGTKSWNKIRVWLIPRVSISGGDERFDDESIGISKVLDMPIDSSFVVPDIWLNDAKWLYCCMSFLSIFLFTALTSISKRFPKMGVPQ